MPKTLRWAVLSCLVVLACSGHVSAQHRSLFSFQAPAGAAPSGIARGADGTLYGVARDGGQLGKGAVVAVSHGVARALYSFRGQTDGFAPSQLVLAAGFLYGISSLPATVDEVPQAALFQLSRSGRFKLVARLSGPAESQLLVLGQDGAPYVSSADQSAVLKLDAGSLRNVQSFESGSWANTLLVTRRSELYGTTRAGSSAPSQLFYAKSGSYRVLASLPAAPDAGTIEVATELVRTSAGTLYVATEGGATPALYSLSGSGPLTRVAALDAPASALVLGASGADVIGATRFGGSAQRGSLFRVAGAQLSTIASFSGGPEGAAPNALYNASGVVYGSAADGGGGGFGTFFRYSDDAGLSSLYSFSYPDGVGPTSLVLGSDGALYGTAQDGGPGGAGTVFKATKDGALTLVHGFTASEGAAPQNVIEGLDGALYGRTLEGGSAGQGTLFKLDKSGALTTLLAFDGYGQSRGPALVQLADGTLYGADQEGNGHIFRVNAAGQREVVYGFGGLQTREGAAPSSIVAGPDGAIYGVTRGAYGPLIPPSYSSGSVFRLTPDRKLDTLYAFLDDDNDKGASPRGLLIGRDGALYGTTPNLSFVCGVYGGLWKLDTHASGALELLHAFTGTADGTGPTSLIQTETGRFFGLTLGGVGPRDAAPDGDTSSCGVRNSTVFERSDATVSTLEELGFVIQSNAGANADQSGTLLDGKDGKLYGAFASGGRAGAGELFVFTPPIPPE